MALEAEYSSISEVPSEVHEFYTERDGKAVLDVAGGASQTSDSSGLKSELSKTREEAAKRRIAAKKEAERADTLSQQLTAVREQLGLDTGDGQDPDADALRQQLDDRNNKLRESLLRSSFKERALEAGVRKDRLDAAFRLADFEDVEVDFDAGEVAGLDTVLDAVVKEMPELAQQDSTAGVDNRVGGEPKNAGLDFSNVQPGDISKLSDEEFGKLLDEGVLLNMGRSGPDGKPLRMLFQTGGDAAAHDIRRARENWEEMQKRLGLTF